MFSKLNSISNYYKKFGCWAHSKTTSVLYRKADVVLLLLGVLLLVGSLSEISQAGSTSTTTYDQDNIRDAVCRLYLLIETSFGALIATIAGVGAIVSCAFGGYRAAWALLACSVGAFILRSLISLFFGSNFNTCTASSGGGNEDPTAGHP